MKKTSLDKLGYTLLVIGALNWGLIGFFEYSLVDEIFNSGLASAIYALVGLAGLHGVYTISTMMSAEGKKSGSA